MGIPFAPVTIGLEISPTGSKGHQHRKPLPPCQRSPVPEPCFYAGARHQSEVGLSLPNRIRDCIFPDARNSRQVSGTSDCAGGTLRCFYRTGFSEGGNFVIPKAIRRQETPAQRRGL